MISTGPAVAPVNLHPGRTGTVQSGDVALFYRHFGEKGRTPVVILHGANYYDSEDWIEVAQALSKDREVVTFDMRGFGNSGWSPSKNYSFDAITGDVVALLDHFGWPRAIVAGHSVGGSYAILTGSRHPERVAGVALLDHCPGEGVSARPPAPPAGGPKPFSSHEAALAATSRDPNTPIARVRDFCRAVDGGFLFRRDPAFSNRTPTLPGWSPVIVVTDPWQELAAIKAPLLAVRATKSDRFDDARITRIRQFHPMTEIVEIPCGHDLTTANGPDLVTALRLFLNNTGL